MTARGAAEYEAGYTPHIGESRQYWRDIILGVNDGLVSMFLLVAGVVGGGLNAAQILLKAIAGAVAGAISMAAGEYLATKSQDEVLEAELVLERTHIRDFRGAELDQLREMFTDMGLLSLQKVT
jgi:VIT1/CCC1 family predicted Fe2+/Mn2+ transporter